MQVVEGPAALNGDGTPAVASSTAATLPGMVDATPFFIGTSPSPSGSSLIPITIRQIATFDPNNILITAVAESP